MHTSPRKRFILIPLVLACMLSAGCGGGSDSAAEAPSTTTITGTVTAGPVDGCTLVVLDVSSNIIAGPVTATQGAFTVNVPNSRLAEDLVLECTGGSFTDEASGTVTTAGTMNAYVAMNSQVAGAGVHITPGSTVIRGLIRAGLSRGEAESAFTTAFGFTPDSAVAPNLNGDGAAEQNLAGLRTGAFSHLTADLGHAPATQFALLTAITEDLAADGVLDGAGATTLPLPADTANHYVAGLLAQGRGMGLQADKLGTLPFAKVAETESYRIEYQEGMMGAMQGKTAFKLKITARETAAPITGATLTLMPTMAMATMSHGAPVDRVTELGEGVYQCTVYYLMASTMNGMSAGYWSLKATINAEVATFYPEVMMAMGDTSRATLKDANDKIAGTMGQPAQIRSYYLFKNSLAGESGNHTLKLFIATRESMMDHPPLSLGQDLTDESGQVWAVTTMTVQVSTDEGATWTAMTDEGGGHWTGAALPGLVQGESATLLVRLTVNGVEKTGNGEAGGAPASFTMTP